MRDAVRFHLGVAILWGLLFGVTLGSVFWTRTDNIPRDLVTNEVESWIIVDDEGKIQSLSFPLAHMLGCFPPDLVGKELSVLIPDKYKAKHYESYRKAIRAGHFSGIGEDKEVAVVKADMLTYDQQREFPVEIRVRLFAVNGRRYARGLITPRESILEISSSP